MKKFILPDPPDSLGKIYLKGNDFHYLVRIRRLGKGSFFKAFLPDGTVKELEILSINNEVLTAQCGPEKDTITKNSNVLPPVYLFQALLKGAKMDLIVRQAAECGISAVVPFVSEYSQVRIRAGGAASVNKDESTEKTRRWNRIIREARQQSGSAIPTQINAPCNFDEIFLFWEQLNKKDAGGVGIFFHQDHLESGTLHDHLGNKPGFVVMAVGPEGGFSPAETQRFKAAGFNSLVLGDNILRAETAALYGAAAIQTILSERASWLLKTDQKP